MTTPHRLANLYDAHHQRHMEDLPFWLELARNADGPILELGCGTGRILLPLLNKGYQVFGLDRDADMLAVLHAKSVSAKIPAPILQADMAAFLFRQSFSLIILPCNTLSTLENTDRLSMLDLVAYHLTPGGIFAASIPNPRLLSNLPTQVDPEIEENFPHPLDNTLVQVSSAWEHDNENFTLFWHYNHLLANDTQERLTATSRHLLTPSTQIITEIEAAGLNLLHQYGDFNRRPFTRRSRDLIIIAQKPV